jgi:hypothetical protein
MARKREEIAQLLANKFQSEAKRLNSWGTKTDSKAAITFAMAVVDFVRALMSESRMREMRRFASWYKHKVSQESLRRYTRIISYAQERIKATRTMSRVIEEFATKAEEKRPWKPKEKPKEHKHKHRHYSDRHFSKHELKKHKEKKHGHSH